jgi:hypothetical protein
VEFQPLSGPEVTREDQMLHALEYIAQAPSGLMRERVAQHGVLALEGTREFLPSEGRKPWAPAGSATPHPPGPLLGRNRALHGSRATPNTYHSAETPPLPVGTIARSVQLPTSLRISL